MRSWTSLVKTFLQSPSKCYLRCTCRITSLHLHLKRAFISSSRDPIIEDTTYWVCISLVRLSPKMANGNNGTCDKSLVLENRRYTRVHSHWIDKRNGFGLLNYSTRFGPVLAPSCCTRSSSIFLVACTITFHSTLCKRSSKRSFVSSSMNGISSTRIGSPAST